jgi:hypothetical protein
VGQGGGGQEKLSVSHKKGLICILFYQAVIIRPTKVLCNSRENEILLPQGTCEVETPSSSYTDVERDMWCEEEDVPIGAKQGKARKAGNKWEKELVLGLF